MIYIFDNSSLSNIINHYYPDRFPSFWEKFESMVKEGKIISVREVRFELAQRFNEEQIDKLNKEITNFFIEPSNEELNFITNIYSVNHFQQNLDKKRLLQGGYFADPFVIAKAWEKQGTVVTEENFKENAARIPNICRHFNIPCLNLEGFLIRENWRF